MSMIFDCDGVLVDSEKLAAQSFSQHLASIGIEFTVAQCLESFTGNSLAYCYQYVERAFDTCLPRNFDDTLRHRTVELFDQYLTPVEGVIDVLEFLQEKNISYCVASNGSHEKIQHSLKKTALVSYFKKNIFSADDVKNAKPAPDLFAFAAKAMAFDTSNTWVVEDSSAGVQAAKAASMNVIYFNEKNSKESNALADIEISNLRDMLHVVGRIF